MQKILVVEDDPDIQELLQNFLREAGYEVGTAFDGVEGLGAFEERDYDLVLLDVMLPKLDGFALCELIRRKSRVPIIMLTALSGEKEQIRGLDLQVDDYITKPFSMPVLIRKVAAVLRRSAAGAGWEHQTQSHQNLTLHKESRCVFLDWREYELTCREFEVLWELLSHRGRVLTRQNLLDRLWKYDFYGDERVVETLIKIVRKLLGFYFINSLIGVVFIIDRED